MHTHHKFTTSQGKHSCYNGTYMFLTNLILSANFNHLDQSADYDSIFVNSNNY